MSLRSPGVLGADRGEKGYFLTAQTAHTPPLSATESDVGGTELGTAGFQELTQLIEMRVAVHDLQISSLAQKPGIVRVGEGSLGYVRLG